MTKGVSTAYFNISYRQRKGNDPSGHSLFSRLLCLWGSCFRAGFLRRNHSMLYTETRIHIMAQTHYKQQINAFAQSLRQEERAQGTIENYLRHLRAFAAWLGGGELTPATAPAWKAELLAKGYAPGTVNAMLVPLNRFLDFLGYGNCKVKALRIQRRLFRENRKELTRQEYDRLLSTARTQGKERLALLMEAICATGIRVSEVQYLTVEALREGRAEISLKGKIRTILIPGKPRKKLLQYAKKEKTLPARCFAPETESPSPASRFGQR